MTLVGEAPGPRVVRLRRPGEALTGRAGDRLAALAGVDRWTYLRRTEAAAFLSAALAQPIPIDRLTAMG